MRIATRTLRIVGVSSLIGVALLLVFQGIPIAFSARFGNVGAQLLLLLPGYVIFGLPVAAFIESNRATLSHEPFDDLTVWSEPALIAVLTSVALTLLVVPNANAWHLQLLAEHGGHAGPLIRETNDTLLVRGYFACAIAIACVICSLEGRRFQQAHRRFVSFALIVIIMASAVGSTALARSTLGALVGTMTLPALLLFGTWFLRSMMVRRFSMASL